jgi:hypothetical protein
MLIIAPINEKATEAMLKRMFNFELTAPIPAKVAVIAEIESTDVYASS